MTQLRAFALALVALSVSVPALALASDSQILSQIHHKNQSEISLARLAENRSTNDSVLGYARRIVVDHKKADQQTMDLGNRNKIEISKINPTKEESATQAKLSSLMGPDFDKAFLQGMKDGHSKVISWLDNAEKQAKNTELKSFISEILPTLHQHHDLAAMVLKKTQASS